MITELRQKVAPDRQLGLLVSGLALISVAALVGQIYGIVDMTFVLSFFSLPATILIIGIIRWTRNSDLSLFYKRALLGLAIGLVATVAYDGVRLALQTALPLNFNAFAVHPRFGALIIDQPHTTTAAKIVGWSYHISNGLTFALCFSLVAGKARWWWGVVYAMVLQTLMVLMYPRGFGVDRGSEAFLLVSFIGHASYGLVLGLLNQRFNQNDPIRRAGR